MPLESSWYMRDWMGGATSMSLQGSGPCLQHNKELPFSEGFGFFPVSGMLVVPVSGRGSSNRASVYGLTRQGCLEGFKRVPGSACSPLTPTQSL